MDLKQSVTRRTLVAAGVGVGIAAMSAAPRMAPCEEKADEVVIFHTNDMHGYLQGNGSSVVGIDYVAGLREQYPDSLLLDAGDATQGAPFASLTKGSAIVGLMNEAGYDAMCLGNHEFDYGLDVLATNVGAADFPVLAANALHADGTPVTAGVGVSGDGCSTVLESGGRRIGVFGLVTSATAWSVMPGYIGDVTFADEIAVAERQIARLADQDVDAIVCLAHLGDRPVPCRSTDLAELLSDEAAAKLTAIIDGHSHTVENIQVRGIAIVQTGCYLANVGKLVLTFSEGAVTAVEERFDVEAAIAAAEPDATVAEEIGQVAKEQQEILGVEVCINPTTLWGGFENIAADVIPTRVIESNLGDFVCDAMRWAAQDFMASIGDDATPVVAVCNGGGIRAALWRGMLARGDLLTVFPFANTVMVKYLNPVQLKGLFECGLVRADGQDPQTGMLLQAGIAGGFMQVSGATVVIDPNQVVGRRVSSITLDGCEEALDLSDGDSRIAVVSNSFVMTGGTYDLLSEIDLLGEIGGDFEGLEAYARMLAETNGGVLPPMGGTQGRLMYRGGYEPAPWEARVLVVDEAGAPLVDQPVQLQIDGCDVIEAVTDDQGLAAFAVDDGFHGVAIAPSGDDPAARIPETLIDNYIGLGLVVDDLRSWPTLTLAEQDAG